jgi:hypothetical protein
VFTTSLNLETLRSWAAAPPRPDQEHLVELQLRHHPPPGSRERHPRGMAAAGLARVARRIDGEAARRAIA